MSRAQKVGLVFSLALMLFGMQVPAFSAEQDDLTSGLVIPDVVARVNDKPVYGKYIQFQLSRILKNAGGPVDLIQKGKIVRSLIEKEVVRELVYQEGKKQNIAADMKVLDEEIKALRSAYESPKEFEEALKKRDISEADLRQSMETDLIARQLLEKEIKGKVEVNDADTHQYYDDHKHQFVRPETFRARHIFIAPWPLDLIKNTPPDELEAKKKEMIAQAEEKIKKILEEVRAGGDFAELAKKYSQDAGTAENGGDIDFIYKGVFDPAFDEAVSKLKPGEVSDVVKSTFGYHIIKLIETRPSEQASFEEMKEAIQKNIFMEAASKKVAEYTDKLRDKAKVEVLF